MEVVVSSCAVTNTVIGLGPTTNGIGALAAPDATATPLTCIIAVVSVSAGVIVREVMALATLTAYAIVAEAKAGLRVPLPGTRLASVETAEGGRVTVKE